MQLQTCCPDCTQIRTWIHSCCPFCNIITSGIKLTYTNLSLTYISDFRCIQGLSWDPGFSMESNLQHLGLRLDRPFHHILFSCYYHQFFLHNIIIFLEFLYVSSLSPKAIANYLASLQSMAKFYNIEHSDLSHIAVSRFYIIKALRILPKTL